MPSEIVRDPSTDDHPPNTAAGRYLLHCFLGSVPSVLLNSASYVQRTAGLTCCHFGRSRICDQRLRIISPFHSNQQATFQRRRRRFQRRRRRNRHRRRRFQRRRRRSQRRPYRDRYRRRLDRRLRRRFQRPEVLDRRPGGSINVVASASVASG